MYGICGVAYFCGKTASQKYFFQILSPKKTLRLWISKSRFGFDPKNPPRVWILWIYDPFLDLTNRNAKSVFGFGNPDLDFSQKTHPQTPYFLPTLTPALTFKMKLLALHERGNLLYAKQNHYACKTMQKKATYIRIYIQVIVQLKILLAWCDCVSFVPN